MWGDDEKVIQASTLPSSSLRLSERASKEFLKNVEVAGDGLHPLRVALVELKKGSNLVKSKKASSVVTSVVWQVLCLVWKAGQGVEALACGQAFMKVKFKS